MRRAVRAGVMFASPRTEDHDGWVRAARQVAASVPGEEAAAAFPASLTSRRLDLRSALGSYAIARFLPEHDFEVMGTHGRCAIWASTPGPESQKT